MCSNWRNCAKKKKKKDENKHLKKKSSLHKQHHRLSVEPVGGEITVHCCHGYTQVLLMSQHWRIKSQSTH